MHKGTLWIFGTLVALGLAGGSAWAAQHGEGKAKGMGIDKGKAMGRHHAKMFEKKDADGDGSISLEEWTASSRERFEQMDADGDGALTSEEMKGAHRKMRDRWKDKKDDDADDDS